jgi:hypothetical protein
MTDEPPPRRPITAEDVVRRIAAECAFISANGEVGIRLRPAAALVRHTRSSFVRGQHAGAQDRRNPLPSFDPGTYLMQSFQNDQSHSAEA